MRFIHSITLYFPTLRAETNDWPRGLANAYIAAMSNKSSASLLLLNTSSPDDGPSPAMHPRKDLFGVTDNTLLLIVTISASGIYFLTSITPFCADITLLNILGFLKIMTAQNG
jgi:hypothetical protein